MSAKYLSSAMVQGLPASMGHWVGGAPFGPTGCGIAGRSWPSQERRSCLRWMVSLPGTTEAAWRAVGSRWPENRDMLKLPRIDP